MREKARPEQIDSILNDLNSDDETTTELRAYIADLEAKQPERPAQIAAILAKVGARYSAEVEASLEVYISQLEANQQSTPPDKKADSTTDRYWRSVKRDKEHKARALQKQNNARRNF
jgi:hypothetical protein